MSIGTCKQSGKVYPQDNSVKIANFASIVCCLKEMIVYMCLLSILKNCRPYALNTLWWNITSVTPQPSRESLQQPLLNDNPQPALEFSIENCLIWIYKSPAQKLIFSAASLCLTQFHSFSWGPDCRYKGSQRSFLIPNTLFRIGASAAVMTNKRSDLYRCKYQLQNVVRVNLAAENDAYQWAPCFQ